jgi:hypothetical protein
MGIILAHWEVLRDLEDFQMTIHIVAMVGQWNPSKRKLGKTKVWPPARKF